MLHVSPTLSPLTFLKALFAPTTNYLPNIHQFSYARGALICAITSIIKENNLKSTPTIWAPSFVCDTVFYLLEDYDIPYKFYPINSDLLPDWEKINKLQVEKNDIFLLVYFFGFPMGIKETVEFCKQKDIFLIEDCAHSIVSEIKPNSIGSHGDAAIFGLRKALPLPHGGFLYMKNTTFFPPPQKSTVPGIYRAPLKMIIQWILSKLKVPINRHNPSIKKSVTTYFPKNYGHFNFLEEMSPIAKKITNTEDIQQIVQKRQENFQEYDNAFKNVTTIRKPSSLVINHKQTTPWIYFFYYDKAEKLINKLREDRIPASDFPTLYPTVLNNSKFEIDNQLYKTAVSLPVHQDLSPKEICFIIERVIYHIESDN